MKIFKVTTGFVTQVFDTELNRFVEQNFTAGDEVVFEDESGDPVDPIEDYLPFDMIQPELPLDNG